MKYQGYMNLTADGSYADLTALSDVMPYKDCKSLLSPKLLCLHLYLVIQVVRLVGERFSAPVAQ